MEAHHTWREELDRDGFTILRCVYGQDEIVDTVIDLSESLRTADDNSDAIRSKSGTVYAVRNLLDIFPAVKRLWQCPRLLEVLSGVLGSEFGLVRGLYFDKPPEQTWLLAWHKDVTIAVERNDLPRW